MIMGTKKQSDMVKKEIADFYHNMWLESEGKRKEQATALTQINKLIDAVLAHVAIKYGEKRNNVHQLSFPEKDMMKILEAVKVETTKDEVPVLGTTETEKYYTVTVSFVEDEEEE